MDCIPVDERCIQLSSSRHRVAAALRKIPLFSVRTAGNGGKDKPSAPGRALSVVANKCCPCSLSYFVIQQHFCHKTKHNGWNCTENTQQCQHWSGVGSGLMPHRSSRSDHVAQALEDTRNIDDVLFSIMSSQYICTIFHKFHKRQLRSLVQMKQ
jgi:hypothetical protein